MIPTKLCKSLNEIKNVGDYLIDRSRPEKPVMFIFLPQDSVPSRIRLYKLNDPNDNTWWQLSGPDERPTLSPSLHAPDIWHGYLRDGMLVPC